MTPQERDNYLKAVMHEKSQSQGDHRKWQERDVLLRRESIYYWMGRGKSRIQLQTFLADLWETPPKTVKRHIKDAEDALCAETIDNIEDYKKKMIEKLQRIADDAMANGDRKSALAAYEQINKLNGAYTQKIEAEVSGEMHFDFGE